MIENKLNVISAMNFHAYGNMWIWPFNYSNSRLFTKDNEIDKNIWRFFNDFESIVKAITPTALYGNAISMVKYRSFGEASDWMLGAKNIVAFSPELGTGES